MSVPRAAVDVERRAALNGARLAALVAGRWGPGPRRRGALGTTATLVERGTGWVLPDGDPARSLGPALVWAEREGVEDLHLLAGAGPDAAGLLARQASLFVDGPAVWAVEGTGLVPAAPAATPARLAAPAAPELIDVMIDAGVEIVVEGGVVRGEVEGLEVARIVLDPGAGGAARLEVGVGRADRELTAMVHAGLAPLEQLSRVVAIVRRQRRPGAGRHPLNQLVPERWLRAVLCREPALVGLAALRPAEGARPRPDLRARDVAMAVGEDDRGRSTVVACSVGVALDLVPTAADGRAAIDAGGRPPVSPSRLLLAVPERDAHPRTRDLAARLRSPAEVVTVPGDWRAAG
ncbi:MAG TPA: hypothetical protein VFW63_07295 [Acidimicrobiales bacterium]|nr:hypothetical protein [Acidimicrobiales bacterium]